MIGCLLIHGYTGSPHELEPLTGYLQKRTNWEIQVPILPGHGNQLELEDVSYEEWMSAAEKAYVELRKRCDIVYVIGFSMGGMIAVYLAAKYDVTKLVLLATAGKYLSFRKLFVHLGEVIEDGIKGNLQENEYYLNYKGKWGEVPFKANIEFMKLVRLTRKYLKNVKSPVFIAQGQMDGLVPYQTAYYLDKEIPSKQKEIVFFEESNHLICLGSDKETLNKMVYDFLTEPMNIERSCCDSKNKMSHN
ncbi:alpha/beta fold hydrolase [Cerasibacillus terrae]|uniref:Alpha/beta fold hydrolase n=1 Tax=Cerasibacillus terrae TaxID=2498845 RepID=A0A5C8NIR5_9BACI|nr:alpha/beta fold hydrolase [Cerasibacillus terrae]TXL61689.1 alpha/beta fold hydrolase [Cerasibacillus terrae]